MHSLSNINLLQVTTTAFTHLESEDEIIFIGKYTLGLTDTLRQSKVMMTPVIQVYKKHSRITKSADL